MIETILNNGVDMILGLQNLGDWIFAPMKFFTFLGTEDFYLLVMPILLWCVDARLGLRVGIILLASGSVNTLLKWTFHLPRPYWYDARVTGMTAESSFGVPSGHSQLPASIYGLIAATIKRSWAWTAAIILIALIGFSRMVLGVHFHIAVLIGWTAGFLVLWAFLRLEAPLTAWLDKQSMPKKLGSVFIVSLLIILSGSLLLASLNGFELEPQWVQNALADQPEDTLDPLNLNNIITHAGALFGLAAGAFWLAQRGGFSAKGQAAHLVLRVIIGLAGVLVLWQGLGAVFPRDPNLLGFTLRYIRYALIGLWMAGLAPALFIRFGLAQKS